MRRTFLIDSAIDLDTVTVVLVDYDGEVLDSSWGRKYMQNRIAGTLKVKSVYDQGGVNVKSD
jgi:hypothetical protein